MLDAGLLSLFTDGKTQLSGLDPILILTAAACSMPQQEPQERERERESRDSAHSASPIRRHRSSS
jgi:hypothetical protein